jgi:Flp pilus assembly pilin Flp
MRWLRLCTGPDGLSREWRRRVHLIRRLSRFGSEEDGVDMIEYACIIVFLALAGFLAMTQLSTSLSGFFASISDRLPSVLP